MNDRLLFAPFAFLGFMLVGCSAPRVVTPTLVLPLPMQVSYESELGIARLGQMLNSPGLTPEQRAELFFQRGVVFDRVGLRAMARLDFNRALRERPDFADAYNLNGVYLTQNQEFDEAYEAFDSALDLAPDYAYANLNRGIALYYGGRPTLAARDLKTFLDEDPADPYRLLWWYLALEQTDPDAALDAVRRHQQIHGSDEWAWDIVNVYLGSMSDEQLLNRISEESEDNQELAERLCEAYFYLAKQAQRNEQPEQAMVYFKLALATNIYDFVEHRYSLLELDLIGEQARLKR
ncbi:lipoprotein NlpI [Oceanisphaera litoralis]|uniref:lipoprotein NlpI n=1 Tax=Oceanisphaera litoralis TaxID=225144 RepID=UPI0023BAEA35|nr:lipoprotein NlpI [Oceanisphaera litoralis]MBM7454441.1 lipoprotein NlpI [Oceanisphaera litoralis]